jgi:hypothetical protein
MAPDSVVLRVLEPGCGRVVDVRDAIDSLQTREVVVLEEDVNHPARSRGRCSKPASLFLG